MAVPRASLLRPYARLRALDELLLSKSRLPPYAVWLDMATTVSTTEVSPDPKSPASKSPLDDGKSRGGVTLPPIDATPEEIAQALFQKPPLKKPKGDDANAC